MKYIFSLSLILLLSHSMTAQNPNYDKLWQEVLDLEQKSLPKSALESINQIAVLAKKHKNSNQVIKTLIYKSKYALILEEDAHLSIIKDFKFEIATQQSPEKQLLESLLANLYWQYYQQYRHQFYNRTKTETKVDADDFRTWDLQTLFDEIQCHFQNSLEDPTKLQQTPLSDFDALLNIQADSKTFRPTLFDFLSHQALEFYKSEERTIHQPSYKFEIDDPKTLGTLDTFIALNLTSKDSTSQSLNTIKLYQNLIRFHKSKNNIPALVAIDIERLQYVKSNAVFEDKFSILLETLQTQVKNYKNQEVSGNYQFEIANLYEERAQSYDAKTQNKNQWDLKTAIEYCDTIISSYPKSTAAKNAQSLKAQILSKSLQITAENNVPIQEHSLSLIRYKNIDKLNFKIYSLDKSQEQDLRKIYIPKKQLEFINSLTLIHQWDSELKDEKDFNSHSTEVALPKLNNGQYLIFASPSTNNNLLFAYSPLQVTNLSINTKDSDSTTVFQVIDRRDGTPQAGVKSTLTYKENYNSPLQSQTFTTDSNGQFEMSKQKNSYYDINISLDALTDHAVFDNYSLYGRYNETEPKNSINYTSVLFTDRSIYRPGQTVYFKAIAMAMEGKSSTVLTDQTLELSLYDTNGQILNTQTLKSNSYGSIAGEFILPDQGLTGAFRIGLSAKDKSINSDTYFVVEEYKRPKFEVQFNPVTESYKVNDSINVHGNAKSYAGSLMSNAKVVYRVKRQARFPQWHYWSRPYFNSTPQEIAHGETQTNAKGEFEISFIALPELSLDAKNQPVFNYEVSVDVTDINGETRSSTTFINIGYHSLTAAITIDSKLDNSKKDYKLKIETQNLNNQFVPAKGQVQIYKLKGPDQVLRQRPWAAPDYKQFSKVDFANLFPHEAYDTESNPLTWDKGLRVWSTSFDTGISKTLSLGSIKSWKPGRYSIVLESEDKFGQSIKEETQIEIYDDRSKSLADNSSFSIHTDKEIYKTGEQVLLTLGTSAEALWVNVDVEKNKKIFKTFLIPLHNEKKSIVIPITADDIGGFAINYSYALYNSFISGTTLINVSSPETALKIETISFRDRLKPGVSETWSLKIKGSKGEKVSAELLASMYDASLDQFNPHQWYFDPLVKPTYYASGVRQAYRSFGQANFNINQENSGPIAYTFQNYDSFNWFGLYFGSNNRYMIQALRGKASGVLVQNSVNVNAPSDESLVLESESETKLDKEFSSKASDSSTNKSEDLNRKAIQPIKIRKDLKETAFFFPNLETDKDGNVSFTFETPEALTVWKLQLLAHTKSLESTIKTLEVRTQKELMVIPNLPRFLREGDKITISTKIANLSESILDGQAYIELTDAITGKSLNDELLVSENNKMADRAFKIDAQGNTEVSWELDIKAISSAIEIKIIATSGAFSDGEQSVLPVLSNRQLVTETLPIWISGKGTKTFSLEDLKTTTSESLKQHKLTLEMTSNPAWYAIQALPYLMEGAQDTNEQLFSRYYANALAQHITKTYPQIEKVFNQWKSSDALLSNLEKNQELKDILIQETPWLRDAQSETEQKKRIALLFDINHMKNALGSTERQLANSQNTDGSWSWIEGGQASRYITQVILTGFGRLNQHITPTAETQTMINNGLSYLDQAFIKEYQNLKKYNPKVDLTKDQLSSMQLQYLYMRSLFPKAPKNKELQTITDYYHNQIKTYWTSKALYEKGLMTLISSRAQQTKLAHNILKSIEQYSITSEELGMYWKENSPSYRWNEAPIETQALIIEAFTELQQDEKIINLQKIWLLKNKQTNHWSTTKATSNAIYALLLKDGSFLNINDPIEVQVGAHKVNDKLDAHSIEAGTGYFKTSWNASEIVNSMADVKITNANDGIAWGSLYWQYFEDLDKIKASTLDNTSKELSITKKLFLKTQSDTGELLTEITESKPLKIGDLVRVRIELKNDRPMDFVHMKDMRASGLEPVNVLSQYKWQDGLGYYESTKDVATHFFFDHLPKGVYVFEYDLRVSNVGVMSNGISTIECMYAPEFGSHTEGIQISVEH